MKLYQLVSYYLFLGLSFFYSVEIIRKETELKNKAKELKDKIEVLKIDTAGVRNSTCFQ
jgi:hypothetical protein